MEDASKHWDDEDRLYSSGRDSDESPIISYRYDKYRRLSRYSPEGKTEDRERRSTVTVLAKFFLFCTAMILFCALMYIPVYNRASYQVPKGVVSGWSAHTNRDTKIYVRPNNVTTVHEPKHICTKNNKQDKLFLLIVICSATANFEQRQTIRETWGNYEAYPKLAKVFNDVREKYKNYNYTYDLYVETGNRTNRQKRDISIGQLLPELAKVLENNVDIKTEEVPESRFDDDMLPEFDMNKELGDGDIGTEKNYDYDYETNVMKIPPRGYEDDDPDLGKILSILKKAFPKTENVKDYKLMFLLGLPQGNSSDVQLKIDEEASKYGDILQEGFIDSYNNLTLKSIMMLKWVTNQCNDSVRYILKTDDDMYINVPNLISNLKNRSRQFDADKAKGHQDKEYLLIGDLICGAKPVLDEHNKWFSPRYMYAGRVYPRYLSGTGYVLSSAASRVLYTAALNTHYFHLEDIYITGMCALRASPRVPPADDAAFAYQASAAPCYAHAHVTAHRVPAPRARALLAALAQPHLVDRCERMRLTQMRSKYAIGARLHNMYKYLLWKLSIEYSHCNE